MSEDLISNNFVENVNRSLIKRNLQLVNIIFTLVNVYVLFVIYDWYKTIASVDMYKANTRMVYAYRIRPVLAMLILIAEVLSWSWIVKANKLISSAFEKNDAEIFNEGYTFFNKASIVTIISFSVSIISIFFRLILRA